MKYNFKRSFLAMFGALLLLLIQVSISRSQTAIPYAAPSAAETQSEKRNFGLANFNSYLDLASKYCTKESKDQEAEWRKKFLCESKITDAVIAFLTIFLAIFTALLVWVGRKQEQTTRRQMRAFVYLEQGAIYNVAHPLHPLPSYKPTGAEILSPTDGPIASLTIKNSGSTPAFHVVHWGNISVAEFPLKSELLISAKQKNPPSSAIPPGGINTKNVRLLSPLTTEQIAGLRNGSLAIWIYGEITYRDAFRRKRTSKYRLFHGAQTGNIGVTTDLTWAEGGNEAT